MKKLHLTLRLIRVYQWIKNAFVLIPLFFSFDFTGEKVLNSVIAFILFCFLSSGVYVINDLKDKHLDRLHPVKKHRPIASGEVSEFYAKSLAVAFSTTSLFFSFLVEYQLFIILIAYFILNILYSYYIKHVAIFDVLAISFSFLLRLIAGSVVTDVSLSMWIIVMTFLLAMFISFAKRREDVLLQEKGLNTRESAKMYNAEFLNATMIMLASVIVVTYILYTVSDYAIRTYKTDKLYITSIFVILGIIRYMQITMVENRSGDPTALVLRDRFLRTVVITWFISFIFIARMEKWIEWL
ncbi:MAG: UbiA prenyltransferase family protein [Aquificaceae bacterium]|nr:UbiA prenyltransferase family protein [Aquificaceae bacterium]